MIHTPEMLERRNRRRWRYEITPPYAHKLQISLLRSVLFNESGDSDPATWIRMAAKFGVGVGVVVRGALVEGA